MDPISILVAEDEGIVATDLEWQLRNLGYRPVGVAVTGEEAITLAGQFKPALVLMDIHLAGTMDGIEAATIIRERFTIPSIFVTAYATDDIVERAKQAEPLGYLTKPFDERALRSAIEIALHRAAADERLRASEARYRSVIESAHDAILTVDREGRLVGWNPAAERIFGYAEADILGQSLTRLMPERFSAAHQAGLAQMHSQGILKHQGKPLALVGLCRDGHEVEIELSLSVWTAQEGTYVTGIIRDISERNRREALIQLQSAALEAAAEGIAITDVAGTIVWVNAAFSEMTGYTLYEAVGRNPRELVKSGVHDQAFYQNLWTTITGGAVWTGELTNRRKDGSHYPEQQSITPVRDGQGAITHFIAIKRDLTEEKQRSAAYLQAQKMEVVGRLVAGVAHDFNNLLAIIAGTSALALEDLPPDHAAREDLQQIKDAGDRAAGITRQLLAFSRKQIAVPVILSVSDHVRASAKMLQRLIGEDIDLVVESGGGSDTVRIDPGHFDQLLMNLVVNARDAMPSGGVLTVASQVVNSAWSDPAASGGDRQMVRLTVSDTGTGIAPDVLPHLFEPFFTTKEHGKGTGLGLATVAEIVRQSRGTVSVTSEPGAGAVFTIELPQQAGSAGAAPPDQVRSGHGTETILLVEDDVALQALTERMLKKAGYTVLAASDGEQAVEMFERGQGAVHLLLTDVVLPGMNGVELAARLTARTPLLKVIYMSGYTGDRLPPEALSGAAFIAKPFVPNALTAQIRRTLDSSSGAAGEAGAAHQA